MKRVLSPGGALAGLEQPGWDALTQLAARHEIDGTCVALAAEIARLEASSPQASAAAAVLALAVLLNERNGGTRLALSPEALAQSLGLGGDVAGLLVAAVAYAGAAGPLVGPGDDARKPLVCSGGFISSQRSHWLDASTAQRLLQLRTREGANARTALDASVMHAVVNGGPFVLSQEQAAAVEAAMTQPLIAISGGPGTGKTAIVTAILRALFANGVRRVALAAPTGKAANRMQRVLAEQVARIAQPMASDADLAQALPQAKTLHRLLGYRAHSGSFRHGEDDPLPYDVVIVDEGSMVDAVLMERLLRSLGPQAALILLGDANQLPSVGAGRCFADIIRWGTGIASATGSERSEFCVQLTQSFRMDPNDPDGSQVYQVAQAVLHHHASVPASVTPVAAAGLQWRGVEWVDAAASGASPAVTLSVCDAWWRNLTGTLAGYDALVRREYAYDGAWGEGDLEALKALSRGLEASRVLAATRQGPLGNQAINARLHAQLGDELARAHAGEGLGGEGMPEFLPGEPVMFTANDYERGIYNGDAGVIVRVRDGHGAQRFHAVFDVGGVPQPFPLDAVRTSLELAWAITTHKSQGSEYDGVVLVLPLDASPVATRELVYTALTRARRSVVLVASSAALAGALAKVGDRSTGLVEAIQRGCGHDLLLNGACLGCGAADIDPVAASPKPPALIAPQALTRRR